MAGDERRVEQICRVFAFQLDGRGKAFSKDVSGLNPSAADRTEADWGGLRVAATSVPAWDLSPRGAVVPFSVVPSRAVLCAAALAAVHAFAAPPQDVRALELLAAAKAATGGAAWDRVVAEHQVFTLETAGLKGTGEVWVDARTGHYGGTFTLGPTSGAKGWDGTTFWSKDASGQVRLESGASALVTARTAAYRNRLAYWYPDRGAATITAAGQATADGRTFDVVRIVPEGGRPFDLWIATDTHRIERMVEKKELDTTTSSYSDWRTVNGLTVAFTERSSIGDPKYDMVSRIQRVDWPESVPPSRFAPPSPPPPDYTFAGGASRTTIPFALDNNHIYLSGKLNGKPVRVLFDTGASNYLHSESAPRLGVRSEGALPGGGVGENKQDTALASVDSVALGDITLRNQVFAVAPFTGWLSVEGTEADAVLGYELFKRVPTVIDYARRTITFFKPEAFQPPAGVPPIAFRFAGHIPEIDGSVDGVAARLHLDTGSRSSADLTSPFIEKHKLVEKYAPRYEAATGWGVGGPARSRLARAKTLVLGGHTLREPVVNLTTQKRGAFTSEYYDANIGGEILRRFTVAFDYASQKLWLVPGEDFASPFTFDRSGMFLGQDRNAFVVKDVTTGGPADKAGLEVGDTLLRVNGKTPAQQPLPRLREWLKTAPPGTKVRVDLPGGREVTLTLEDLV